MICVQKSWQTSLSTSSDNELVQKSESLSSLSTSETTSENSIFENELELEDYNSSKPKASLNLTQALNSDNKALESQSNNIGVSNNKESLWSEEHFIEHYAWDQSLDNEVFESSYRKCSIDSNSSNASRKSQHKLKTIIDWVQKNGRRASVKCKSLKRKGSFPQNDKKKLHCTEAKFTCLNEVLGDKENLRMFREFLVRELSDENLDFWCEVELYRKQKSSKRTKTAQKIFDTFVATSSSYEINIDSCVRKQIQANLQQANPDLFDCAQAQIYQLMERDSFRRFSNQTKQRSQA